MKKYSHALIHTALILSFSLFSGLIYADSDNKNNHSFVLKLETFNLQSTPQQLRSSAVRALLDYHWQIKTVEKDLITAEYRDAVVEIKFPDEQTIEIHLGSDVRSTRNIKWVNNLIKGILIEIQYYHYTRQFGL